MSLSTVNVPIKSECELNPVHFLPEIYKTKVGV